MTYRLPLFFILASCLLTVSLGQDIRNVGDTTSTLYNAAEGAIYRHINSESVLIRTTTASFNISTARSLSRDIFDADEQVSYATCILWVLCSDYEIGGDA